MIEKPTPTEAEQRLLVPGIRAGYYLCFFGIHVFTPTVMDILDRMLAVSTDARVTLVDALAELARQEQYLAIEDEGRRYDLGAPIGLLIAQLALALNGRDRSEVLSQMLELLADRELAANRRRRILVSRLTRRHHQRRRPARFLAGCLVPGPHDR